MLGWEKTPAAKPSCAANVAASLNRSIVVRSNAACSAVGNSCIWIVSFMRLFYGAIRSKVKTNTGRPYLPMPKGRGFSAEHDDPRQPHPVRSRWPRHPPARRRRADRADGPGPASTPEFLGLLAGTGAAGRVDLRCVVSLAGFSYSERFTRMSAPKKAALATLLTMLVEVEAFIAAHPELAKVEAELIAKLKAAISAWIAKHAVPAASSPLDPKTPKARGPHGRIAGLRLLVTSMGPHS